MAGSVMSVLAGRAITNGSITSVEQPLTDFIPSVRKAIAKKMIARGSIVIDPMIGRSEDQMMSAHC